MNIIHKQKCIFKIKPASTKLAALILCAEDARHKKKTDDSSQSSVSTLPLPRLWDTQSLSATLFNNAKSNVL